MTPRDVLLEFGQSDYQKGMRYVLAGRVEKLETAKRNRKVFLTAEVQGTRRYEVYVELDDRSVTYCCDCPQCDRAGQCKHVTATLLAYLAGDRMETLEAPEEVRPAPFAPQARRSDLAAQRLLKRVEQDSAGTEPLPAETGGLHLLPQLYFGAFERLPKLGLTVGEQRQYVVKDIGAFLNAVNAGEEVSYGKGLTFVHSPGAFDEAGQRLLKLVKQAAEECSNLELTPFHSTASGSGNRLLTITPHCLDRLFELYLGQEIGLLSQRGTLLLCAEPPEMTAVLRECEEGMELELLEDAVLFNGAQQNYLVYQGRMFPCDRELTELAESAAAARQGYYLSTSRPIFFAEADLPTFAAGVLPRLKRYFTVEGDEAALGAYTPDVPVLQYYLDWDGTALLARLQALYQGRRVDVLSSEAPDGVRRNPLAERRGRSALEKWFGPLPYGADCFCLTEEVKVFAFVQRGLSELQACGEVYTSDAFRDITPEQPRVSVGVSVSGGLLDLEIDTGAFPLEELEALAEAVRSHRSYYRLRGGGFLSLEENQSLTRMAVLKEGLGLDGKALAGGRASLPLYRAPYLDQALKESNALRYSRDDGFRKLVRSFRTVADSDYTLPAQYRELLRPYQKTGFRWLKTLAQYGFGGILADDMGLGKTVQALSFLSSAKEEGNTLPSLVVCPASLVLNWGDECRKFAPELNVLLLSGGAQERREQWERVADCDLAVISYDSLRRDAEHLEKQQFYTCILDEAQYIKNHTTVSFKTVKRVNSRLRFAMTGTPVENRLSELWSIFDFLMPGYLYRYSEFQSRIEKPVAKERDEEAEKRLGALTRPFILRRMKADVLKELPPKTESVRYVALGEEQRKLYTAVAMDGLRELKSSAAAGGGEKLKVLVLLTRLRQICCDPRLCLDSYAGESAKLESCMELVTEALDGGHRILLFSQFTSMLELLRRRLEQEGIRYFLLQGSTPKGERASLVERFNRGGAEVFLISLKAGGTGLNLTGADTVIHYDPWWNEAAQNQATDRAHRIGQRSAVQVYKLIGKNTIEEKILELQQRKRELADAVAGTEEGILALSSAELLALLEA